MTYGGGCEGALGSVAHLVLGRPRSVASPGSDGCRVAPFCCLHGAIDIGDEALVGASWILDLAGRIEYASASLDHLRCDDDIVWLVGHGGPLFAFVRSGNGRCDAKFETCHAKLRLLSTQLSMCGQP